MTGRGELERAVLRVLWEHPEGITARGVAGELPNESLAMTTVLTALDRLRRKDRARRDESTRPHTYFAAQTQEEYIAAVMWDALGQATDRDAALTRFLGGVSDADAASARRFLRRR